MGIVKEFFSDAQRGKLKQMMNFFLPTSVFNQNRQKNLVLQKHQETGWNYCSWYNYRYHSLEPW